MKTILLNSLRTATSVVIVLSLIAGCALFGPTPAELSNNQLKIPTEPLNENEGIVFGSIEILAYYDSNEKIMKGDDIPNFHFAIHYAPSEKVGFFSRVFNPSMTSGGFSKEAFVGNSRSANSFFVKRLPAGEYTIYKFTTADTVNSIRRFGFRVLPNRAAYIGSMQIELFGGGLFGERDVVKYRYNIVNDFASVKDMYKKNNPKLDHDIATELMGRITEN